MEKKFFSINGDINTQVYEKFLKFVDEVNRSDTEEIVIIIDSNGGEITYGFDNKRILQCYLNNPELKVNIPNFTELFDSGDDLEYTPNDVVRLGFATKLLENISDIYCIPKKVEIY